MLCDALALVSIKLGWAAQPHREKAEGSQLCKPSSHILLFLLLLDHKT